MTKSNSKEKILQLKITLKDTKPPIWRRFIISEKANLFELHTAIQIVMGWTNTHLHQFNIFDEEYAEPHEDDYRPKLDEKKYTLKKLRLSEGDYFLYEYDFGDGWDHKILVEKVLPPESDMKYPICTAGKKACPPEDCGGTWGYSEILEILNDPKHPEYEERKEWLGDIFNPDEFDLKFINEVLADTDFKKGYNLFEC